MDRILIMIFIFIVLGTRSYSQSIHFSQYYNAPVLVNPANTALMSENDYRIGVNYRNQWAAIPVPYNTLSAFTDCKVYGKSENKGLNKWLGIGLMFSKDKAGDGNLSLQQAQCNVAYHMHLAHFIMLSLGFSGAYAQRYVNYDILTFDAQWDGEQFNSTLANGEKIGIVKTDYYTIASGINLSVSPNENVYVKLGGSIANINRPTETFYKHGTNTLDYRINENLDVHMKTGPSLIINPSAYYATQSGSSELIIGSLVRTALGESKNHLPTQLILGVFYRIEDAVIGAAGIQVGAVQFLTNYDVTTSSIKSYNASYGGVEFSIIYEGIYNKNRFVKRTYDCPKLDFF